MKRKLINTFFFLIVFIIFSLLGKITFTIFMALLASLSLRELITLKYKDKKLPIEIELLSYIIVIFLTINSFKFSLDYYLFDYRIFGLIFLIYFIPLVVFNDKKKYGFMDSIYLIAIVLFIGMTFNIIAEYQSYNIYYLLYIIVITYSTRIFESISNHYIGRYRYKPAITLDKTYEGVASGIALGTFVSSLFYLSFIDNYLPVYAVVLLTGILSYLSIVGELVFTYIKGEFGKKKFSNIILKNSGILDMMDSMIFVTFGLLVFTSLV